MCGVVSLFHNFPTTAEVNVAISNIACGINITLLLLHLLRILLGPYPLPIIVSIYYLIRSHSHLTNSCLLALLAPLMSGQLQDQYHLDYESADCQDRSHDCLHPQLQRDDK